MIQNLKKLRSAKAVSQACLARAIGTTQQNINKYENYDCNPSIEMLSRIADYFDTSVDYLIGRTDNDRPVCDLSPDVFSNDEMKVMEEYRRMTAPLRSIVYQAMQILEKTAPEL